MSRIGKWRHCIPRRSTSTGSVSTWSSPSSCSSTSETTAPPPARRRFGCPIGACEPGRWRGNAASGPFSHCAASCQGKTTFRQVPSRHRAGRHRFGSDAYRSCGPKRCSSRLSQKADGSGLPALFQGALTFEAKQEVLGRITLTEQAFLAFHGGEVARRGTSQFLQRLTNRQIQERFGVTEDGLGK